MVDLAIVGAGPIGIEAAILAKRAGLSYLLLEKGCVVNAIAGYPTYMTFFTTSERLEVGGHPLVTATDKPTRKEALDYYRKVVHNEALELRSYTEVAGIERRAEGFRLRLRRHGPWAAHAGTDGSGTDRSATDGTGAVGAGTVEAGTVGAGATGAEAEAGAGGNVAGGTVDARTVVVATGYFDNPKRLGVEGEDLPNVSHYYREAHPYFGRRVTIVGAGSSAADAALDLFRAGARVTILHRREDFRHSLKYWIRPNLENRVKEGSIRAHFRTVVRRILPDRVVAEQDGEPLEVPTEQTFLLTGYAASTRLLEPLGVRLAADTGAVELDPDTFEASVPGLYVIGSAGFGSRTSDVFIENGLVHARAALRAIEARLRGRAATPAG